MGQGGAWTAPHLAAGSTTGPQARPSGGGCGSRRGVEPGGPGVSSPGLEPRQNPLGTGVSDYVLTLPLWECVEAPLPPVLDGWVRGGRALWPRWQLMEAGAACVIPGVT